MPQRRKTFPAENPPERLTKRDRSFYLDQTTGRLVGDGAGDSLTPSRG